MCTCVVLLVWELWKAVGNGETSSKAPGGTTALHCDLGPASHEADLAAAQCADVLDHAEAATYSSRFTLWSPEPDIDLPWRYRIGEMMCILSEKLLRDGQIAEGKKAASLSR